MIKKDKRYDSATFYSYCKNYYQGMKDSLKKQYGFSSVSFDSFSKAIEYLDSLKNKKGVYDIKIASDEKKEGIKAGQSLSDALYNILPDDIYIFLDLYDSKLEIDGDFAFQSSSVPRTCSPLSSIRLPETLKKIGANSFLENFQLYNVTLPEGLQEIGEGAFNECHLFYLEIPASVTKIGKAAFSCTDLRYVNIDRENKAYKTFDGDVYSKDGEKLFMHLSFKKDESFIVPENVTSIGDCAFLSCFDLENIVLPEGLKEIGEASFLDCESLNSVKLPSSVSFIGKGAFEGCDSLESVVFKESGKWYGTTKKDSSEVIKTITLSSLGKEDFSDFNKYCWKRCG